MFVTGIVTDFSPLGHITNSVRSFVYSTPSPEVYF